MKYLPALMGGALALLAPSARAGIQGWLDFGPDLPGESTDPGHAGWADVESFSSSHDPGGPRLICLRKVDKASPRLMDRCVNGKHFTEVKLNVAKTVSGKPVDYWEISLQDVIISSYTNHGGTGGIPIEELCLEWKSLVFTYRVFPEGGPSYTTKTLVSPDTDGDGLPDSYEESVGLDGGVSNLGKDSDKDGVPDTDEYRLGTHPNDPTSFFSASSTLTTPDNGNLTLKWPSVAGEEYRIEYSPNLATPFTTAATITATSLETTYAITRTLQAGFFRVTKSLP